MEDIAFPQRTALAGIAPVTPTIPMNKTLPSADGPASSQAHSEVLQYIHLKVHSAYSLLEGAITIPRLAKLAVGNGFPALGLTDKPRGARGDALDRAEPAAYLFDIDTGRAILGHAGILSRSARYLNLKLAAALTVPSRNRTNITRHELL